MVRIRSPEFPSACPWLNCPRPLSLKALRGRVILLDFWTYGCINCLHVIPDLHYLEQKYSEHLTIIGIHTAKFDHEWNLESIEQAILRYGITHAVLVDCQRPGSADRQGILWDQYAVRAYPTFVLIDPQGYIVTTISGEGRRSILDDLIQQLIQEHIGKGTLSEQAIAEVVSSQSLLTTLLAFPGKVLADESSNCLFIADTGHHRIVVTTLNGAPKAVIGNGLAGWQDGAYETAQFFAPQGMALECDRQILYIADAGNHLIRQVDLCQQTVRTIAGTGTQNRSLFPQAGKALNIELNSPWDLVIQQGKLYVAMAGCHQIWQMDLTRQTIETLIGTGAEYCVDGPPDIAAFAQPYGIATDGTRLLVADSETSSIRIITFSDCPIAQTLCGQGELFKFGDRDGIGLAAQLQHCSGLVYAQGAVWVVDTYNHKIKQVHLGTGECHSIAGQKTAGFQDGIGFDASFSEPSGLSWAGDQLYIADTNNHAIRCMNLNSLEVKTLLLPDLCSPTVCFPSNRQST